MASGTSLEGSQQDLRDIWSEDEVSLVPSIVYNEPVQRWHADQDPASSLITPFSEVLTPSLRSFDPGTVFQSSFDLSFAQDATYNTPNVMPSSVVSDASSQQRRSRHDRLMRHFIQSINPTQLMQPSQQDWATVCSELTHMARDCAYLRSTIYSLSALHLYCTAGHDSYHEAVRYYQSAVTEVNNILDRGSVDDAEIRQAFAANFLLVSAEVRARSARLMRCRLMLTLASCTICSRRPAWCLVGAAGGNLPRPGTTVSQPCCIVVRYKQELASLDQTAANTGTVGCTRPSFVAAFHIDTSAESRGCQRKLASSLIKPSSADSE